MHSAKHSEPLEVNQLTELRPDAPVDADATDKSPVALLAETVTDSKSSSWPPKPTPNSAVSPPPSVIAPAMVQTAAQIPPRSSSAPTTAASVSPDASINQPVADPNPPLTVKDALAYLDLVKEEFRGDPGVYNNFLEILKEFKSERIDTPGVIERVCILFVGHPALIQGYNVFLPPGYRIECPVDPKDVNMIRVSTPQGTTTHSTIGVQKQAIEFLDRIKKRYADDPASYQHFLELFRRFNESPEDSQALLQIFQMLRDAAELLNEFKLFLPSDGTTQANSRGIFVQLGIDARVEHEKEIQRQKASDKT